MKLIATIVIAALAAVAPACGSDSADEERNVQILQNEIDEQCREEGASNQAEILSCRFDVLDAVDPE